MKQRMEQRITSAQALIAFLADMNVTAVICGGYARDTICDKPIRDVDLYVSERDFWIAAVAVSGLGPKEIKNDPRAIDVDEKSDEYQHQSIRQQREFDLRADKDFTLPTRIINVIGLKEHNDISVADVTSRYNLGICKAGIDAERISVTDDFRSDYKDKQITLLRTGWGHEATMKQFLKLQAKYPWPLRVPKQEEGFF
jgi:hypothetical protein